MKSVCETGGVVQLRRCRGAPFGRTPPNPNGADSPLLQQEMHNDQVESSEPADYSDIVGYPSLPRPKTILRKGFSRTLEQAPKLSTVQIRPRSRTENDVAAAVKANRDSNQHTILVKQNKRKSLNVSDLSFGRQKKQLSCSSVSESSLLKESGSSNEMSNHSRAQSRKLQNSAASTSEEDGQKKSKKSRKPSKSLTFSFGSNSAAKRRALGFLGRGEKKGQEKSSPVTPESPILVSKKTSTLPSSSRSTRVSSELPTPNGSSRSHHGSYQDIAGARSLSRSLPRSKQRPPPLLNLSGTSSPSMGTHGYHGVGVDSPLQLDYSPALTSATSGMSSRQESSESLSECSLPPSLASSSRGQSPNVPRALNSRVQHPYTPKTSHQQQQQQSSGGSSGSGGSKTPPGRRKFSDPLISTPTQSPDTSPPRPGASSLKKRYTFCVRPSRVSPDQGWVSLWGEVCQLLGSCWILANWAWGKTGRGGNGSKTRKGPPSWTR